MKKIVKIFFILFIVHSSLNIAFSQVFWNECTSPVTTALRAVSNIDGNNAWICGAGGVVLKTTNNGYNWTNVSGNGIPNTVTLISIFGVSSSLALTAGYTGTNTYVYRTSNGGANWTQVFFQANGFINAVWMLGTSGIIEGDPVGGRWSLWLTNNGGLNWDSTGMYLPQAGAEAGWNNSLWIYNGKIWFGTNNSRIYYTDNGPVWQIQSTAPEVNSYAIAIDSGSQFLGFTGGATLLKTTNAGVNWTPVTAPSTGNFTGLAVIQTQLNYSWFVRGGTSIYYTPNTINNWQVQYTAPAGNYNHIALARIRLQIGPGLLYAVRSNGGISRGNFFIEGVKIISNEIPSEFKLYQNYPNPFNPSTKIKFNIPKLKISNPGEVRGSQIRINVYDAIGREIETLVNQINQPGVYEDSWDGSNYPSGIYYYRLVIADPKYNTVVFSETKKMVLVK